MPITFRQYLNSENRPVEIIPVDLEVTPSVTPIAESPLPSPTPTPTPSISLTPAISPTNSPTPSVSQAAYYYYEAIEGECNPKIGTCEGEGDFRFVYSPNGPLNIGLWYTASISRVYQPVNEVILNYIDLDAITIDNNPYNDCGAACSITPCFISSSVTVIQPGWVTYQTCEGVNVYYEYGCTGSYTIDDCIKCSTVTGSAGPGGSGSLAVISVLCGFDCFIPPTPTPSTTPSVSITPTITPSPSNTVTPTVTPTPSVTPSVTLTPSVTPTIPISPSCTCPVGYTASIGGQTCYSSSVAPAVSGSGPLQTPGYAGTNVAWGDFGVRIYPVGGFNQNGELTVANYAYQGLSQLTPTSSVDKFWSRRLNSIGMWDGANQFWPGNADGSGGVYPGFLSMCTTFNAPTTKTYYIGLAGDNDVTVTINGVEFVNQPDNFSTDNFKWWHIYPVTLTAGLNIIELGNWNRSRIGSFAAEIYDNTLAQLTSSNDESDLNLIFSTGDYLPARTVVYPDTRVLDVATNTWVFPVSKSYSDGPYLGRAFCTNYTCPPGFELDTTNPSNVICRQIIKTVNSCDPPPTPSSTPTFEPSSTPSATPSVTPSVSKTPCPTLSITPTPTVSLTPTPTSLCGCKSAIIFNDNTYFYYDCSGSWVSGSNAAESIICLNENLPYSRNIGSIGLVEGVCDGLCPSPSVTPSVTPSVSKTPSISVTPSVSKTPSATPSVTPSITPSVSNTPSISVTPSITLSPTPTVSQTVYYWEGILCNGSIIEHFRSFTPALGTNIYGYCDTCGGTNQCFDNITPSAVVNTNDVIGWYDDCTCTLL